MSVIKLGRVNSLGDAVRCKFSNDTVSKKTLRKLEIIARGLYNVGNTSDVRDAGRKLGSMKRDVPFAPTYVGLRDVGDARAMIAGMRQSSAKTHLDHTLGDIEQMMYARISQCTSLIIHPEEAEAGELEVARLDLGPRWLDEAERRRSAMLAARTRSGGGEQRFYRPQPSAPSLLSEEDEAPPPSYEAVALGSNGFLPTYDAAIHSAQLP